MRYSELWETGRDLWRRVGGLITRPILQHGDYDGLKLPEDVQSCACHIVSLN